MKDAPIHITLLGKDNRRSKVLAIGSAVVAMIAAFYGVSWQIGSMIAELGSPQRPDSQQAAETAVALAPNDPGTLWLLATREKEKFTPESFENAIRLFENVVRASPQDYRWWIELGRAYEQGEQAEKAEAAFQRAVELAPHFTYPHWQLGNFYLRQNATDKAFAELKKATEGSLLYREQVFSLAWDYFDKDPQRVEELAADTPDVKASLAMFYAVRNSPADALRVWNSISDTDKASHPTIARTIAQGFLDKRFIRESVEFARQSGLDPEAKAETITNPGFETYIGNDESLFSWKVNRVDGKLDVGTDSAVKHSGARSIRLVFRGYARPELSNLSQFVAVQSSKKYSISFWVRTENLRSGGAPRLEIANINDGALLASSPPFEGTSNEWRLVQLDFSAPENCSGIVIRTGRQECGECPIFGTFWYDDFSMIPQ